MPAILYSALSFYLGEEEAGAEQEDQTMAVFLIRNRAVHRGHYRVVRRAVAPVEEAAIFSAAVFLRLVVLIKTLIRALARVVREREVAAVAAVPGR